MQLLVLLEHMVTEMLMQNLDLIIPAFLFLNDVVKLYESGTAVAIGTVTSYSGGYARISARDLVLSHQWCWNYPGQDSSSLKQQHKLVLQMQFVLVIIRCWCRNVCHWLCIPVWRTGNIADGTGVELRLFAVNFNHIGAGKDFSNDGTLTVRQMKQLNSIMVYHCKCRPR